MNSLYFFKGINNFLNNHKKNLKIRYFFLISVTFLTALFIYSCEIREPSAPEWDVNLNLPFSKENYNIFDIIKRSGNIGLDSIGENLVYLFGESNYKRKFGDDIKFDGYPKTFFEAVSNIQSDTSLVIDDSTFIRRAEFLNGEFKMTFYNNSNENYTVRGVIKNLLSNSGNDTAQINLNVNSGSQESLIYNLQDYYVSNITPENKLKIRIIFISNESVPVSFSYSLSQYSIRSFEGRLRPLSTGITKDIVEDPFGTDVPEGEISFASISPDKNFLILKKYSGLFQVDFSNISINGENKNGHIVKLKYLKHGNAGDPLDSVFTLSLSQDQDSVAFPVTEENSNILEFINNIPHNIYMERNDVLNSVYSEGSINYTDSISIKLEIQVPLDISITKPILFSDTADAGISDEDQRKELDKAKNLEFTFLAENRFPLKTVARVLILDSSFMPLLAITKIIGNNADSTITVNAAPVGPDGLVNNLTLTQLTAELDSNQINLLKHMGKIIYDYRLYTDPALITPPGTTVKITGNNNLKLTGFGKLLYRIKF